jgi:Ca2+:H+ antiporter
VPWRTSGLTIAAIAVASIWLGGPSQLGLVPRRGCCSPSRSAGALTGGPGRATLQQGGVHLVLFAAFLFLAANP